MPGKPFVDIAFVSPDLLPEISGNMLQKLEDVGYRYAGVAPHHMNKFSDHWFFRDTPKATNGVKGYVLHIIDSEDTIFDFIAFRDYCKQVP